MSWEPKLTYQGREKTCGLHVIAMITHLPYEYIKTVLPKFHGTTTEEVAFALYSLGYQTDRTLTKYHKGIELPDLCILHVQRHLCLYFKGMIYCSNQGIKTPKEYRARIKSFLTVQIPV